MCLEEFWINVIKLEEALSGIKNNMPYKNLYIWKCKGKIWGAI